MKRLLLHTCCGPCFIYPSEVLKAQYDITSFFYNPNIHPTTEYIRRMETLASYCRRFGYTLIVGDYDPKLHLRAVTGREDERCGACYRIRLDAAAHYASDNGFALFSTTLTVSPYQKHDVIEAIGVEAGERHGVEFIYSDFRPGYRRGQNRARALEMYRQPYCGCIYSEMERYEKKLKKAENDAGV